MSIEKDIYEGLTNENNNLQLHNEHIIFSIGHRCTSSSLIKEAKLKFETYPFDWIVTKLNVIKHCIENRFEEFLKRENYVKIKSVTYNLIDNDKKYITNEEPIINTYYENDPLNKSTYDMNLAMTHHNINIEKDFKYFERCINRFNNILSSDKKKFYLYIHKIMGINDYNEKNNYLQKEFIEFTDFMNTKTQNSYGIFFFVVNNEIKKGEVETIYKTDKCVIFTIYTNNNLIDSGAIFSGDWYLEQYKILINIEQIVNS